MNRSFLKIIFLLAFVFNSSLSFSFGQSFYPHKKFGIDSEFIDQKYKKTIEEGSRYFRNGLDKEAKELFWEAIELIPKKPDAYINLGIVYMKEDNLSGAIRVFEKAEKLAKPGYFQAEILYYNLGFCYFKKKDYETADKYLSNAIKIYPNFAEALFYRGLVFGNLKNALPAYIDLFLARYIFDKYNKIDERIKAELSLRQLIVRGEIDSNILAKKLFDEGIKSISKRGIDVAVVFLQESARINPLADTYYELANLYHLVKNYHQAISYLDKAILIDSNIYRAYIKLGEINLEMKKYLEAEEVFKQVLDVCDNDPEIYYEIGLACIKVSEFSLARVYLDQARKKANKSEDEELIAKIDSVYKSTPAQSHKKKKPSVYKRKLAKKVSDEISSSNYLVGNKGNFASGNFIPQ